MYVTDWGIASPQALAQTLKRLRDDEGRVESRPQQRSRDPLLWRRVSATDRHPAF